MTKRKPIEPVNVFHCQACGTEAMSVDETKKHLAEVHGVKEFKGTRQMTMHVDSADSYSSNYELEIGGVVLHQFVLNPRERSWR